MNLVNNFSQLPTLCVVIPALNEEKYIGQTIGSLLRQDYPRDKLEIVVVVDSETSDQTAKICDELGCILVKDSTYHTIGGACKIGFERSRADIFVGTEADSQVSPNWLRCIAHQFMQNSRLNGLSGPVYALYDSQYRAKMALFMTTWLYHFLGILFRRSYFHGANYAYSRKAYTLAGGFNDSIRGGQDNDLSIRIGKLPGKMLFDKQLIVRTSSRRFKQGYLICIWEYGKLFIQINLRRRPKRFDHIR